MKLETSHRKRNGGGGEEFKEYVLRTIKHQKGN